MVTVYVKMGTYTSMEAYVYVYIRDRLYKIFGTKCRTLLQKKEKKISVNRMMLIYFIGSNMIIISVMGPCFPWKRGENLIWW